MTFLLLIFYYHNEPISNTGPFVQESDVSNITARFSQRKLHMSKECTRKGWSGLDQFHVEEAKRRRPNILYLDSHKALYCVIPKTGCTNWKKVMLYLSGFFPKDVEAKVESGQWSSVSGKSANDPSNLESLNFWSLTKSERQKRIDTYTKFMVVREPFERLVSGKGLTINL